MSAVQFTLTYLIMAAAFLAMDLLWLGVVAKGFYRRQLDKLLRRRVNWPAASLFYLIYLLGMMLFVVQPSLAKPSVMNAAVWGMLYGVVTYGTYELTNRALLKNWPLAIVVVDMAWGAVLCGLVATAGYQAALALA